ncbi:MAG: NAD(P)-dependent alcohol dehydrogenase [Bacteroidota bacterium]
MKAIFLTNYGPPEVLQVGDLEKPVPKENEVLIKVKAATVNAGDCEIRRFDMPVLFWLPMRLYMGLFKPRIKILGQELSGIIEAVGKNVKRFNVGDAVYCPTKMNKGAYVEYVCLPENIPMAVKPNNLSFAQAATIPTGGFNALYFLKKANIKAGDKVLINGAGGCIGTLAVQLAKHYGAEVTAVDRAEKLEMLTSIGADLVIDFQNKDFTQANERYDVIFDIPNKSGFVGSLGSLEKGGRLLLGNFTMGGVLFSLFVNFFSNKKIINGIAPYHQDDLNYLNELLQKEVLQPVVDKGFLLDETASAHAYVETGLKKGNVVITFE